jgi:hypothetical protein
VTTEPRRASLRLYGGVAEHAPLAWAWVEQQLRDAGTYWVVARGAAHPPARPVWGIWLDAALHLSIGSPAVRGGLALDARVTVHLESGTDAVIIEGTAATSDTTRGAIDAYDAKYDWAYDPETYGPFTHVAPATVKAWRTAGVAGHDGFQEVGRWTFPAGPGFTER